jgi:hypothetical protein
VYFVRRCAPSNMNFNERLREEVSTRSLRLCRKAATVGLTGVSNYISIEDPSFVHSRFSSLIEALTSSCRGHEVGESTDTGWTAQLSVCIQDGELGVYVRGSSGKTERKWPENIHIPQWFPGVYFLWHPWYVLCSWAAKMAAKERVDIRKRHMTVATQDVVI